MITREQFKELKIGDKLDRNGEPWVIVNKSKMLGGFKLVRYDSSGPTEDSFWVFIPHDLSDPAWTLLNTPKTCIIDLI